MVSRSRVYNPATSPDRYKEHMVRMRVAYAGVEFAQQLATEITNTWQTIFEGFYNAVHRDEELRQALNSLSGSGYKGKVIRYVNYIIANYILTGKDNMKALVSKLETQGIEEPVTVFLVAHTLCAFNRTQYGSMWISQVAPDLVPFLNENCSKLPKDFSVFTDSDQYNVWYDKLYSFVFPNVPRSEAYYFLTGLAKPKQAIGGTAGGKAKEAAGPALFPITATAVVEQTAVLFRRAAYIKVGG